MILKTGLPPSKKTCVRKKKDLRRLGVLKNATTRQTQLFFNRKVPAVIGRGHGSGDGGLWSRSVPGHSLHKHRLRSYCRLGLKFRSIGLSRGFP